MGGHGGLNILPQKKWNVYNFDNREKVRKDEEEAAKEEQLKREQSRKRDLEFRLEKLREARGLPSTSAPEPPKSDANHINLFDGLVGFSALGSGTEGPKEEEEAKGGKRKREKEKAPVVIAPEDEKYRMGYGVAGKGVKAPWYLERPKVAVEEEREERREEKRRSGGKKSIEELREERIRREMREKERVQKLVAKQRHGGGSDDGHRSRRSRFS